MKRSPRQQRIYLLSIVFAAAPIAFALTRAFNSRYDLRMLWMALASFVGATAVMAIGQARRRTPRGIVALSAVALAVAMLLAGWTALRLGATSAPGIWLVSFVLGSCWAVSYALDTLSRPRTV
ncbi:MAG: hypothetical protein ACJ79S_02880 [Gemmatimonadaceae bacterium]